MFSVDSLCVVIFHIFSKAEDVAAAVNSSDQFDFLVDFVPRTPAARNPSVSFQEEGEEKENYEISF